MHDSRGTTPRHKRFVTPEFTATLIDTLFSDEHLMEVRPASEKGLLRKRFCCPTCGTTLNETDGGHVDAKRSFEMAECGDFDVTVELPELRCSECGKTYVPPGGTVLSNIMKASAHAFRSAAVTPA